MLLALNLKQYEALGSRAEGCMRLKGLDVGQGFPMCGFQGFRLNPKPVGFRV